MIYITGDTHGDHSRFMGNNMNDSEWTKDDLLIICGDFGYIFYDTEEEKKFLDFLETKPYTLAFCDGNHENYSAIYSYPEEIWRGGRVHRIRKNIVHLMRGEIFEIENKRFFVFGGAYSIDKAWRKEGISWWPEEQPNEEEKANGRNNLQKYGFNVDYIITHTAPQAMVKRLIEKQPWSVRAGFTMDLHDYKLMEYLGEILYKTTFRHWFFGHWHFDTVIDEKSTAVYYDVHPLPEA